MKSITEEQKKEKINREKLIQCHLVNLIRESDILQLDKSTRRYIRFIPKVLDELIPKVGTQLPSHRLLIFEFINHGLKSLDITLMLGPCNDSMIRKRIYSVSEKKDYIFNRTDKLLSTKYSLLYKKRIYDLKEVEDKNIDILKLIVNNFMKDIFLKNDMPSIVSVLQEGKEIIQKVN